MKELTPREKNALFGLASGFLDNWTECYIIAYDGPAEKVETQTALSSSVSRWKNSAIVQREFQIISERIERAKREEREKILNDERESDKGRENSVHTETAKPAQIDKYTDFSKPENQFKKLNELVNTATDSAETLDALKVIMSAQKADREAARDGKVVKCYIPITCKDCKLYLKAAKKVSL